jgi:DNA modification methylase
MRYIKTFEDAYMTKIKLIQSHVLKALKHIPDNSIDCIVTSPPYWGLRKYPNSANVVWDGNPNCEHEWVEYIKPKERGSYGESSWQRPSGDNEPKWGPQISFFCSKCDAWLGQLGLEPALELYIKHLLQITAELKRVLKPTGIMFWNHGDTYWSGHAGGNIYGNLTSKEREIQIKGFQLKKGRLQSKSLKQYREKCLCMLPERLALKMVDEQGWWLRNKIIWVKPNALPSSVKDRLTNRWEYVYMFTKSKRYFFNLDAIREPLKTLENHAFNYRVREANKGHFGKIGVQASEEEMKNYDNGGIPIEKLYRFWGASKDGEYKYEKTKEIPLGQTPAEIKKNILNSFKNKLTKHDIAVGRIGNFSYADPLHKKPFTKLLFLGKNPGDVWTINTEPFPEAHFATFPTELVRRCIRAGCPKDGIVLDPFVGSGTTIKVAIEERKNCIGIEIVPEYVKMTIKRCNLKNNLFFDFEFIET